jgi:hypothetical protein
VHPDEPSSLIAHSLSSPMYQAAIHHKCVTHRV